MCQITMKNLKELNITMHLLCICLNENKIVDNYNSLETELLDMLMQKTLSNLFVLQTQHSMGQIYAGHPYSSQHIFSATSQLVTIPSS